MKKPSATFTILAMSTPTALDSFFTGPMHFTVKEIETFEITDGSDVSNAITRR
jgi:hypothetical protein